MDEKEKLRRELAMQSAVAATILDHLNGMKGFIPEQIAACYLTAYRKLGGDEAQKAIQAIVVEHSKSK